MFLDNIASLHILRGHGRGHVVVKNKSVSQPRSQVLSPTLGTELHFHVNSSRKDSIVLINNMAALSRGCKPRIRWGNKQKKDIFDNPLTSEYCSHGHSRLGGQELKRLAATYLNKYREKRVSVNKHWYVVVELVCFFLVLVGILCVLSLLSIFSTFPSCYI